MSIAKIYICGVFEGFTPESNSPNINVNATAQTLCRSCFPLQQFSKLTKI